MSSYHIIGGDTKEYGPIAAEDIRLWIAEGRLNAQSLAKGATDTAWRTLASFPEFADAFHQPPPISPPGVAPGFSAGTASASVNFLERDYELDLGGCITRGWELVKNNLGVFFVGALIYFAVQGAMGMLGNIPLIGLVFSIANFVISGPLMGGVLWLFLRGVRGEPAEVGDVFAGFKRSFGSLFLATLVQGLLIGLVMLPFIIIFVMKFIAAGVNMDPHNFEHDPAAAQQFIKTMVSIVLTTLPVALVCAIPAIYLGTCWKFSLPLIMDKDMDFWTAMKTSMKMVNKHWWQVFGLMVLIGLVNLGGLLACCIGVLFTVPVTFAALMYAYETIFGERKT